MQIAIDGPAGSGKTSLGQALAESFGCRFVETGQMYRAVGLAFDRGLTLDEIEMEVTETGRLIMNGEDVSDLLRSPEIDQASSKVATLPAVRERLVALQRAIAEGEDIVMDGRDIGTVVLPDADVKIFLSASPDERAQRRAADRDESDVEKTLSEIMVRDERDTSRPIAPLNPASDATIIDTDRKPLVEVISEAIRLVKERLDERCFDG
ncbi:MAG: (d)CMP kinase [Candidatus Bipolaricaulia bacterium]